MPGVPWHPKIFTDPLTLSQPWGADYARHFTASPPDSKCYLDVCGGMLALNPLFSQDDQMSLQNCPFAIFEHHGRLLLVTRLYSCLEDVQ